MNDIPSGWKRVPGYERFPGNTPLRNELALLVGRGPRTRLWVLRSAPSNQLDDLPNIAARAANRSEVTALAFALLSHCLKATLGRAKGRLAILWQRLFVAHLRRARLGRTRR